MRTDSAACAAVALVPAPRMTPAGIPAKPAHRVLRQALAAVRAGAAGVPTGIFPAGTNHHGHRAAAHA